MSKALNGKLYIITDNFYPKRISKYNCYTLTNVNVKRLNNDVLVFHNQITANRYLSLKDKDMGYHVECIEIDDLNKLSKCFDLLPIYL